jgi:hypothetical protein
MRTLATVLAVLGLLAGIGVGSPAVAGPAQCFDGYGRPFGPPYDSSRPNYDMICRAFGIGGYCTNVDPQWAVDSCGPRPRGRYDRGYRYDDHDSRPHYRSRRYDYDRRYRNDGQYPYRTRDFSPGTIYQYTPQPNTAR